MTASSREVMLHCSGGSTNVGTLPPFELLAQDFLCLHVLTHYAAGIEERLVEALNGPAMSRGVAKATLSVPLDASKANVRSRLAEEGMSADAIKGIAAALSLTPDADLMMIGRTERALLGLEIAVARSRIVVFSTAGLDPIGALRMYEHVRARVARGSFIHLPYVLIGPACDASAFARCMS